MSSVILDLFTKVVDFLPLYTYTAPVQSQSPHA